MTGGVVVLIVVVLIVVVLVAWAVTSYNGLIRLRNLVQESWRQIDVELKRRHDLIPNLVETVKGYASHERETLDAVIRARAAAVSPGSSVGQQAAQEGMLSAALGKLFAVAEAYPNLKANENFAALQRELSDTRTGSPRPALLQRERAAAEHQGRVDPVEHHRRVRAHRPADYFEVEDAAQREAPAVSFGSSSPAGSAGSAGVWDAVRARRTRGRRGFGSGEYTVPGSTPTYGTPPTPAVIRIVANLAAVGGENRPQFTTTALGDENRAATAGCGEQGDDFPGSDAEPAAIRNSGQPGLDCPA